MWSMWDNKKHLFKLGKKYKVHGGNSNCEKVPSLRPQWTLLLYYAHKGKSEDYYGTFKETLKKL